jgi:hypothetical protein
MPLLKSSRGLQINKAHPLARGLAGCWLLNEGSGDKVFDLSGNNNLGTFEDNPVWTAGKFGFSITLDGDGDCINYANTHSLNIANKICVIARLKLETEPSQTSAIYFKDGQIWLYLGADRKLRTQCHIDWTGVYGTSILTVGQWYQVAVCWDGSASPKACLYINDLLEASGNPTDFVAGTGNVCFGAITQTNKYYLNASISHLMIFNRALTSDEIAKLYGEPFCIFDRGVRPTALFVPTINLAGTSGAQSNATATAKLTRRIKGLSAAATDVTATMKIVGEALLNGSTDISSVLSGKLTLSYRGPWLGSPLKIERQWLTGALFNGMTANAFKLGIVMSCGWFWMRPNGCTVLYRGTAMEKIDFTNILSVAEQNAESMSLLDCVPQNNSSTYFYVVHRFNNSGCQERTLQAAVKVAIDAEGNLAEPLPNHIFAWRANQMNGNKVQLVWFYSPLEQKSKPERFKVYYDSGTGQIDYENPIATISYQGRKFYCWQSEALSGGRYLFAVKAKDAEGIENNSLAQLAINIVGDGSDEIEILKVETF